MTDGSCEFFDVKPYLELSNILVASDEPLLALELLRRFKPAYYRKHMPVELVDQERRILARMATPAFYSKNKWDMRVVTETQAIQYLEGSLRGHLIDQEMKKYKAQGVRPHVFDLGPGEYWLPLALYYRGYDFTYDDIGLCEEAKTIFKSIFPIERLRSQPNHDQPILYVACEIIEHLHFEDDLRVELERKGLSPNVIHVSTPKFTFDGRQERLNWDREGGDLGHLRTYTPEELWGKITVMFPDYTWGMISDQGPILHMRGEKA